MGTIAGRAVLRFKEVIRRAGQSRATVCRKIRRGEFPQPVDLGNGFLGFYDDEFEGYLENLPRVVPSHGRPKPEAPPEAAA